MALFQAASESVSPTQTASLATILPANTPMPLCCDACDHEQSYTMTQLRQLPTVVCEECGDQRQFSQFELTVIENTLNTMGYYLHKSA